MNRLILLLLVLLPIVALAQVDDASIPDASVGEGGADRDTPESQDSADRTPQTCRQSIDCERGFECRDGKCVYTGVQHAQGGGCLGGSAALILVVGALALRRPLS